MSSQVPSRSFPQLKLGTVSLLDLLPEIIGTYEHKNRRLQMLLKLCNLLRSFPRKGTVLLPPSFQFHPPRRDLPAVREPKRLV